MFICAGSRGGAESYKDGGPVQKPMLLEFASMIFSPCHRATPLILRRNGTGQISREYGSDARTANLKRLAPDKLDSILINWTVRRGAAPHRVRFSHAQSPKTKTARTERRAAGGRVLRAGSRPPPAPPPSPLVTAPPSEPSELSEAVAQTAVLLRKMKNTPFR